MEEQNTIDFRVVTAPLSRGAAWLFEGFDYFKKAWLTWIGITVVFVILTLLASLIPIGNLLFNIILPAFFGGLMLGCKAQDQGEKVSLSHLFAGFADKPGQYILLGVLYFVGILAIIILMVILMFVMLGGISFITELQSGDMATVMQHFTNILLLILIALLFYLPLLMAIWFAPALIALEQQSALEAMLNSFKGCLANVVPFLLYGIVGLVLSILASIPLALGWLVLMPMIVASIYLAYKDIYSHA